MRTFQEYHPFLLLIYFVTVFFPVLFLMEPVLILLSILGSAAFLWRLKKQFPWKGILFAFVAGVGFAFMNGLLVHGGTTELFFLNGRPVTLESLEQGGITGLMLGSASLWFDCFSQVLGSEKILILFRHLPKLALLLSMILRLVPAYLDRYQSVKAVSEANRGNRTRSRQNEVALVSAVLTWALEHSMETADSMLYRNYKEAVRHQGVSWRRRDILLLAVIIVCQCMYIYSGLARWLIALVLFGLPLLFEGKEQLKWKFYTWKK